MFSITHQQFTSNPGVIATVLSTALSLAVSWINPSADAQNQHAAQSEPETVTAHELFPLQPLERSFKRIIPPHDGQQLSVTLEHIEQMDVWALTFGDMYRMLLRIGSDDSVLVTRLDLFDKNQAVRYEPPLELIPAVVKAGQSINQKGRAVVYDLQSQEQTHEGSYHHQLAQLSRVDFDLSPGTVRGYLLEFDHEINLDMASVTIGLDIGSSTEHGIVYERSKTTVEKIGLFGDTTIRELLATELKSGNPSSTPGSSR